MPAAPNNSIGNTNTSIFVHNKDDELQKEAIAMHNHLFLAIRRYLFKRKPYKLQWKQVLALSIADRLKKSVSLQYQKQVKKMLAILDWAEVCQAQHHEAILNNQC